MHTSASASPLTVKFSPNWPYSKSSRPSWSCQYRYDPIWYTNTARCSPPCPARSPCLSPSMLSRRTSRGPSTGRFHTAVCTVWPCQATSCGKPTLTDSSLPTGRSVITSCAPHRRGLVRAARQPILSSRHRGALWGGGGGGHRPGRPCPPAGEVPWGPRRLVLVHEGAAQVGVGLAGVEEVPAHGGELGLLVGGERPDRGGRGQLPLLRGHQL